MDIRTQTKKLEDSTTIIIVRNNDNLDCFQDCNIESRRKYTEIKECLKNINNRNLNINEFIQNYLYFFSQLEGLLKLKNLLFTPFFFGKKEDISKLYPDLYIFESNIASLYTFGAKCIRLIKLINDKEYQNNEKWLQKYKKTRDLFVEHNFEITERDFKGLNIITNFSTGIGSGGDIQIDILKSKTKGYQIGHINYECDYLKTESIFFEILKSLEDKL